MIFDKLDFLNSVEIIELDTIPMEIWEELEAQTNFSDLLCPEDDFWGTTDIVPL